jgi:hypothetical protein
MKNLSPLVKTRILFLSALMGAASVSLSSNQAATITITNINARNAFRGVRCSTS